MRSGVSFGRPTLVPAMGVPAGSALPTPTASDSNGPGHHGQGGADLRTAIWDLLPTPSACVANDGEGTETWLARRERVKLTAGNGNGMGMPLTIAVQLLPTPTVDRARIGADMPLPSDGGNVSSDVQPPPPPTLEDG